MSFAATFFVLLDSLDQCHFTIFCVMIMKSVLVHYKMQLRIGFMDCECSIFGTVISDAIFLLRILQAQDVGDGSLSTMMAQMRKTTRLSKTSQERKITF